MAPIWLVMNMCGLWDLLLFRVSVSTRERTRWSAGFNRWGPVFERPSRNRQTV